MSFYGYSARNYVPDGQAPARALQGVGTALTMAGDAMGSTAKDLEGLRARNDEREAKLKALEEAKIDKATLRDAYKTNMEQASARLREVGVQDPESVVAQYYLQLENESVPDAVRRLASADDKFEVFYQKKKGEHGLTLARQEVAQAINENRFTPETVTAAAQAHGVPIEQLQAELDSANKDRTQQQASAIPEGATQETAYRTLASSGQAPTPATKDLLGSLPKAPPKEADPFDLYHKLLNIKKAERDLKGKVYGFDKELRGAAERNLKYVGGLMKEAESRLDKLTKEAATPGVASDQNSDYGRRLQSEIGGVQTKIQQLEQMINYLNQNPTSPLSIPELNQTAGKLPWQSDQPPVRPGEPVRGLSGSPSSAGSGGDIPVMGGGAGGAQVPPELLAVARQAVADPEATPEEREQAQRILSAAGGAQ